jgi:hypothetical protein
MIDLECMTSPISQGSALLWVELSSADENHFFISSYLLFLFLFLFLQECSGVFLLANLTVLQAHIALFSLGNGRHRAVYSHGLASGGDGLPNHSSRRRRSPRVTDSPSPCE